MIKTLPLFAAAMTGCGGGASQGISPAAGDTLPQSQAPECAESDDSLSEAERLYRHAWRLHDKAIVLDSHADTPLDFTRGVSFADTTGRLQVSLPRLQHGNVSAQYLACWVKQGPLGPVNRDKARRRIDELIDSCYREIGRNDSVCGLARSSADVRSLKTQGKKAMLIGVENGYCIGCDLALLDHFASRGVTYLTLCHSKNNDICDSSSDKSPRWDGLSPFGREVVVRMNSLGMLIDLSHASEKTFWDVLELSETPVVCTHSSAKALCGHDRNLTDDQLRAIAARDGVVQVCVVPEFLDEDKTKATFDDYMAHLLHVIEVAGVDHTGIGTDFDGGGGVPGLNGSDEMINVTMRLIEQGFSDEDIMKILGGNFLRVLDRVQSYASDNSSLTQQTEQQ